MPHGVKSARSLLYLPNAEHQHGPLIYKGFRADMYGYYIVYHYYYKKVHIEVRVSHVRWKGHLMGFTSNIYQSI